MDNAALYAELRGDRGGIGLAQYNAVQNAAEENRLAVDAAQIKMATDTDRQIADLRTQGEFAKAKQVLEISQAYLQQLRISTKTVMPTSAFTISWMTARCKTLASSDWDSVVSSIIDS